MTRNGLIIRLIDIALLILFGFIAISDIKVNAQIKLPTPVQNESTESQSLFVVVVISPDATYEVVENERTEKIESLESLEKKLSTLHETYNSQDISLHVLIEPQRGSIIQATINVLDICTKLNITKNIAYDYANLNL